MTMVNLPTPMVPATSFPSHSELSAVVGDLAAPLLRLESCISEAESAVQEWETSRPSPSGYSDGAPWSSALAADVATAVSGERPKTWRAATIAAGDMPRWARAHALARSVVGVIAATTAELDLVTIAEEAAGVESASAEEWAAAAHEGWEGRHDKFEAWRHVRLGETALAEYLSARRVKAWASGQGWGARPDLDVRVPATGHLPDDPAARGAWLALGLHLSPESWLSLPQGVQWPPGSEQLVNAALPSDGPRYTSLVTTGVHVERK